MALAVEVAHDDRGRLGVVGAGGHADPAAVGGADELAAAAMAAAAGAA